MCKQCINISASRAHRDAIRSFIESRPAHIYEANKDAYIATLAEMDADIDERLQELEPAKGTHAEMTIQEYKAKRQRETQEWIAAGMPVQKYSSFGRCYHTPLSAEEANFYGLDE